MENTNKTVDGTVNGTSEVFNYAYSSTTQREIEKIAKKYRPKEEDKLEQV